MSMANFLENEILDHTLATGAYTAPTNVYVGLATSDPSTGSTTENLEAGTLTDEVSTSGTAYARQAATFAAASDGSASTNATITFPTATADFGEVTHVFVSDNATAGAGNVLYAGTLTTAKTISTGDQFVINSGSLTITIS